MIACLIACLITCLYTGETHELHPAQGNKPSIVVEPCDDPKAKRPVPSKIQQTKRPDLPCSSWSSLKSSKLERETGLIDPMCLVAEWLFIVCIRNEVSAVVHSHRKWILVLKISTRLASRLSWSLLVHLNILYHQPITALEVYLFQGSARPIFGRGPDCTFKSQFAWALG